MANLKLQTGAGGLPAAPNALAGADLIIVGQSGGAATTGVSYRTDFTTASAFFAANTSLVHIAGAETITGSKLFSLGASTDFNRTDNVSGQIGLRTTASGAVGFIGADASFCFTSRNSGASVVVTINNANGDLLGIRDVYPARFIRMGVFTVGTLPSGAGAGAPRSQVTDAVAATFGAAPTGGGALNVPVYWSTGGLWLMG